MALQSVVSLSEDQSSFINDVAGKRTKKIQKEGKVFGKAVTTWNKDFAGISESGMKDLVTALGKYCDNIEKKIADFASEQKGIDAYQGKIRTSASDYIESIKAVLEAYVSTMRVFIKEAQDAYKRYAEAAGTLAQNVSSDAQAIKQEAQKIRLD